MHKIILNNDIAKFNRIINIFFNGMLIRSYFIYLIDNIHKLNLTVVISMNHTNNYLVCETKQINQPNNNEPSNNN
jgi:hypothetical protein